MPGPAAPANFAQCIIIFVVDFWVPANGFKLEFEQAGMDQPFANGQATANGVGTGHNELGTTWLGRKTK